MAKFIDKPKSMWPTRCVYLENRTLEPGRWGFLFQGWNLLVSFRQTLSLLQVPSLVCTRMALWQVDFLIKTPKVIPKIPTLTNASKYPTISRSGIKCVSTVLNINYFFWTTKRIKVENQRKEDFLPQWTPSFSKGSEGVWFFNVSLIQWRIVL